MTNNAFENHFGENFLHWLQETLESKPEGLTEYELIQLFNHSEFGSAREVNIANQYALFQLHFILFHGLYRLRETMLKNSDASLQISSQQIQLQPYLPGEGNKLASHDTLASYYLDWMNYEKTDAAHVHAMLDNFWTRFSAGEQRLQALSVLGLDDNVDFATIKSRYRELAMKHHPDRGGEAVTLQQINDAMQILKKYYS